MIKHKMVLIYRPRYIFTKTYIKKVRDCVKNNGAGFYIQ